MTSREQFESRYPVPQGVEWSDEEGRYKLLRLRAADCSIARYEAYVHSWGVWKASREAVVVELPPQPEEPEAPEDAWDDSYMDAYHSAMRMLHLCEKAIESVGLRVSP